MFVTFCKSVQDSAGSRDTSADVRHCTTQDSFVYQSFLYSCAVTIKDSSHPPTLFTFTAVNRISKQHKCGVL